MKITVIMTACNAGPFLGKAIESVLAQTHRDFEFIIVDDGSTDYTLTIANNYAAQDNRIKIVSHYNMGMGPSCNEAMKLAQGDWIARMDADDLMEPNRLERQIAFIEQNPDLVVASSLVHYIDDEGNIIGKNASRFTTREGVEEAKKNHWPIGFHHQAVIFRKDIVMSMGGYRGEFWPADDMELWNRIVDAGHGVLVQPEALMKYRIHASSVTVSKFRTSEAKAQWIESCIVARHTGKPEPTWEEFRAQRKGLPLHKRLNVFRRELARALYKTSVLHFSRRCYEKFIPNITAALVLEPWYVWQRIVPQLKRS